jgi:hypothetical protein
MKLFLKPAALALWIMERVAFVVVLSVVGIVAVGLLLGPSNDEVVGFYPASPEQDILHNWPYILLMYYIEIDWVHGKDSIRLGRLVAASVALPILVGLYLFIQKRQRKERRKGAG